MAINPETNQEDPNYTPPADDTALATGDSADAAMDGASDTYSALATDAGDKVTGDTAGYTAPTDAIDNIDVEGGETYNTAETKVADQLSVLLGKDSAVSQQIRRGAREGASALGMMSSSTAVADASAQNVKALSEVAMKDADTAAKFKLQQQATENSIKEIQVEAEVSGELTVQKAKIAEQQTRVNQEWDALTRNADFEGKAALTELQAQLNKEQKELEAELQSILTQQEIDAGMEQTIINNATKSMNDYHVSIQQLMGNESFLDLFGGNRAAMNTYFNDMFDSVKSTITFNAKSAGVYGQVGDGGIADYIADLAEDNLWDESALNIPDQVDETVGTDNTDTGDTEESEGGDYVGGGSDL